MGGGGGGGWGGVGGQEGDRGGVGAGGELPIYGIVWMCVSNGPPFHRCQVYD